MNYLSVCSGIEAATAAWHVLGWTPVAFSEIEPFPSAVLAHHYPDFPNWGDMTQFEEWPDADVDVLVGGTPCQSFSVAGLRHGLADPRGNLALTYLAIADRYRPRWLVWENVPGVLSADDGRAFGALLGGVEELGYGWAYRTLDAQYFGVAQRRRRVFVVASLAGWAAAGSVLFEPESLRGDPAPRREAGQGVTPILEAGARTGKSTTDERAGSGIGNAGDPMFTLQAGKQHAVASTGEVAHCLNAGGMGRQDYETETLIAECATGHDGSHANAGGQLAVAFHENQRAEVTTNSTAGAINSGGGKPRQGYPAVMHGIAARRLTPIECERLQGFSDGYTAITYRGKPAADGPRYKALGNSMAVSVMRWIGRRMSAVAQEVAR